MQFSAVLLAAAAGLVSAQKFTLVAIRSGSDIQNDSIESNGKNLVLNNGDPTTYEVIDRALFANGKPVVFGNNATIVENGGSKDIIVNGEDHLYVPNFDFTACPNGQNGYDIVDNASCKSGGLGFVARAIYVDGSSAAAPASSAPASKASSAAAGSKSETAAGSDATAVVTQINDGQIQAPHGTGPAQAPTASAPPAQANGAATLGVSAVAGVVAVAMLF
ncbi:hypothetical protein CJU90_6783 [Yarrowia sp. C11]|nr:hypothetical protein CJU90_6783 [Yarrowia sp. C11]KAG5359447.1 hypothetical protein CKK34_5798 [Yarrowia sp. E02]